MNENEFVWWLKGYIEGLNSAGAYLEDIKNKLKEIESVQTKFTNSTPLCEITTDKEKGTYTQPNWPSGTIHLPTNVYHGCAPEGKL